MNQMFRSVRKFQTLFSLSCHGNKTSAVMSSKKTSSYPHSETPDDRLTPTLPLDVSHDVDNGEFYITLSKGQPPEDNRAYLQYSNTKPGLLDLEHTVVPYTYRGQGIAKILAKAAFDFCVKENKDMKLTCTYLQKFYDENPQPEYVERVK